LNEITIKQGDTRNCIKATLRDKDGELVDLTDLQVLFNMKKINGSTKTNTYAHVEDAVNGEVWYVWNEGDTDVPGRYRGDFEVIYLDGKVETFPNNGYINIKIIDNLK